MKNLLRAALLQVLRGTRPGASKVKEADSLKFPEFPRPENLSAEEIRASLDKPDEAWKWLMDVYQGREDSRRLLQEPSEPGQFVTLDTKILAKLSRVVGAQILNFKEVETANGRVVRGRQVLFMFEQYFKKNDEAGALYSALDGTEDLLNIHLVNDDLATFIRN